MSPPDDASHPGMGERNTRNPLQGSSRQVPAPERGDTILRNTPQTLMTRPRIMIVEDDDGLRQVIHIQLEREGFEITSTPSAEEALAILEKSPQHLVITDLGLPGISGIDLLKRVRVEYPETAIILMTAFGTVQTAIEAMKAGAYDYITK